MTELEEVKELDKKFCETFEIKPTRYNIFKGGYYYVYPPITDHILLELVCLLTKVQTEYFNDTYNLFAKNIEELKTHILEDCISEDYYPAIKDDVRKLFEE